MTTESPNTLPDDQDPHKALWHGLADRLNRASEQVAGVRPQQVSGQLIKVAGLMMEAVGCHLETGQRCQVQGEDGSAMEAEVVGFDRGVLLLMPIEYRGGLSPGARVTPLGRDSSVAVGDALLGRVIDGAGRPLDNQPAPPCLATIPLHGSLTNPLNRSPVTEPLDIGVRAINGLLTVGKGQRIGLFSTSGTGKSTLLGMVARNTGADIIVLALIGERGREVGDFITRTLGRQSLQRSVVIAAPADHAPVMRLRAALLSHRIAEYFRDSGHHVLLLMDSLTRYAQARREVGLAIGEPPAARGYPPSAFNMMSRLVERAGNGSGATGSLTAFYTVLMEGDTSNDPVAEAARAILDGHLELSHELAVAGCYPAIDVLTSVSRTMAQTVSPEHLAMAATFRQWLEKAREGRELKLLGVYQPGRDPLMDRAMVAEPAMIAYLKQAVTERFTLPDSIHHLKQLITTQDSGHGHKPSTTEPADPAGTVTAPAATV